MGLGKVNDLLKVTLFIVLKSAPDPDPKDSKPQASPHRELLLSQTGSQDSVYVSVGQPGSCANPENRPQMHVPAGDAARTPLSQGLHVTAPADADLQFASCLHSQAHM